MGPCKRAYKGTARCKTGRPHRPGQYRIWGRGPCKFHTWPVLKRGIWRDALIRWDAQASWATRQSPGRPRAEWTQSPILTSASHDGKPKRPRYGAHRLGPVLVCRITCWKVAEFRPPFGRCLRRGPEQCCICFCEIMRPRWGYEGWVRDAALACCPLPSTNPASNPRPGPPAPPQPQGCAPYRVPRRHLAASSRSVDLGCVQLPHGLAAYTSRPLRPRLPPPPRSTRETAPAPAS